ncbi:MAG: hypothetical protein ACLPUT_13415 [Solirubrobacteraceae bacterium]|jgi:hypothetical protein
MRKVRKLVAATTVAFFAVVVTALAINWTGSHYYLSSGQNGFLNRTVIVQASFGKGENRAVCAGIRYYGLSCVGRGSIASYIEPYAVLSEPYLHNHDTEGGYFVGEYLE